LELIKHAALEDVAIIVPEKDDDRNDLLDDNGLKVMVACTTTKGAPIKNITMSKLRLSVRKLA
jgi:hypothetical protein